MQKVPEILIKTNGLKTTVFVDGNKLEGVGAVRFTQDWKEHSGVPILQLDLKAAHVTLDAKILPALPYPFSSCYLPINALLNSEVIPEDEVVRLCKENGIDLEVEEK